MYHSFLSKREKWTRVYTRSGLTCESALYPIPIDGHYDVEMNLKPEQYLEPSPKIKVKDCVDVEGVQGFFGSVWFL